MITIVVFIKLNQNIFSIILITKSIFIIFIILKIIVFQIDLNLEYIIFNDIIIYNILKITIQIVLIINEFSKI